MGFYSLNGYSERTEKIISCFGKIKNKSVAKMFGVSSVWVSNVWKRAGLSYDDEDFKNGYY